jgi:hypothetical protein
MMNHHLSFFGEARGTSPPSPDSPKEDYRTESSRRGNQQQINVQNGISGAWIYFNRLI